MRDLQVRRKGASDPPDPSWAARSRGAMASGAVIHPGLGARKLPWG